MKQRRLGKGRHVGEEDGREEGGEERRGDYCSLS